MFVLCCAEIIPTSDISMAFKDIDVGVLVGAMPRREGMERKDLLKANVKIFKQQGQALDQFAKKNVKVGTTRVVLGSAHMLSKDGFIKIK